jgi:hypothetical protein
MRSGAGDHDTSVAGTAGGDDGALFAQATAALRDGRPGDAIATYESLADHGVVDAAVSFDRGLAYAARVRLGSEVPGDLGHAAHGFEEARELATDPRLADDATRALAIVRGEVAHRRARSGESVPIEHGAPLARAVAHLLSEDAWAGASMGASVMLGLALFARWLASSRRGRIGASVAAGVASLVLALAVAMTLGARHDRRYLSEAVVIVESARPCDERGLAIPNATPLPEAARVEIIDTRPGFTRVRWGPTDAWVASSALRPLARTD